VIGKHLIWPTYLTDCDRGRDHYNETVW